MKIDKLSALMLAVAMTVPAMTFAQEEEKNDTVPETKEVKNRNVMLNASSDNQPRQISIGLPSSLSAIIYEDGLPVSYNLWPCLPYLYWTGTAQHSGMGVMSLGESAIKSGTVNYAVTSKTRTGGEKFEGHANYTTNIFGLQRFDLSLAGPIANGWSYSIGAYANLDPGSNDLADIQYANDMKIFKASVSKVWNDGKGKFNLFYRYAYTKSLSDSYGPFIYVGDGSVEEYNGFSLGKDGFLPANGTITYVDVMSGEEKTITRESGTHALNNSLTANFNYTFDNGMNLDITSKYNYANAYYTMLNLAGVGTADENSGYTYASASGTHKAGDTFTGYYNSRYLLHDVGYERDWLTTAELTGKSKNHAHNWRIGANIYWNRQGIQASTGVYAHTVEADPVWLNVNGSQYSAANTGGEYYDTHETKFALYLSDDWQVTNRLWLSAGLRGEYYSVGGQSAMAYLNATDTEATYTNNVRNVGFNVADGTITKFSKNWFNPAATINGRFTISHGFGLIGEYVYAMSHPNSQDFAGAYAPILDAVNTHLGRFGLFWNTPWMQLVSQVSLISQSNYKSRTQFTNPSDASDVVTIPITYDVQTMGWTTDIVLTPFKGFTFHGLLTLQSPKYKNFAMTANFSDGTSSSYDFSDNITTGVSKTIIELDPSYVFDKFRVWASFRYQSKQYINKTNTLYFNGRWETFGGIDYNLNKNVSFSVNVINFFNQKGCDGSISAADLLEDVSAYKNYLMAGTYIRPFTVEFATHINF
ncbi:MAG: 2,6-beta-D-fructofuranosidase [Prevotellaceae bacterium]|nr:2,6-beta-D-fructofuranosidase [Prevotellaceae bacterium]